MIRTISKHKLSLYDVEINLEGTSDDIKKMQERNIGIQPLIYYNGYQLPMDKILSFSLYCSGFIPTFTLDFVDPMGIISEKGYPVDDTVISFFIRSTGQGLMPIRLDFKILDFSVNEVDITQKEYKMSGILNIGEMFIQRQEAYKEKTSFQLLKEFAEKYKLGFASNIPDTKDQMNWLRVSQTGADFIDTVTSNAYIGEEKFMYSFIDHFYNLNFFDIETQLREDATLYKGIINSYGNQNMLLTDPDKSISAEPAALILTNDHAARQSNLYFSSYDVINKSTSISLKNGYKRKSILYDIRGNWGSKAGKWLQFDIDSITTPGAEKESVILKGGSRDPEFYKEHQTNIWCGKLDKDNTHPNFSYIHAQNKQNLTDLNKIQLKLIMPQLNFNLFRFMKILVQLSNQTDNNMTTNYSNETLSGEWLITGLDYFFTHNSGSYQEVNLIRREIK